MPGFVTSSSSGFSFSGFPVSLRTDWIRHSGPASVGRYTSLWDNVTLCTMYFDFVLWRYTLCNPWGTIRGPELEFGAGQKFDELQSGTTRIGLITPQGPEFDTYYLGLICNNSCFRSILWDLCWTANSLAAHTRPVGRLRPRHNTTTHEVFCLFISRPDRSSSERLRDRREANWSPLALKLKPYLF